MTSEALRLELIEWLTQVKDTTVLEVLKAVKDAKKESASWWQSISEFEKRGIERGLLDSENGRLIDHDLIKQKHGL